jgi:multiple sugar transport system permease protein
LTTSGQGAGVKGPNWLHDSNGVVQNLLGAMGIADPANPPSALVNHGFQSLTWWDWISGPSVAMCAIIALVVWTTAGTFMLIYLAALQDIPVDIATFLAYAVWCFSPWSTWCLSCCRS